MAAKEKPKLPLSAIQGGKFPVLIDLPQEIYQGIGKVVSAHAILETQITELLFELSQIKFPVGRVTFRYQAASERFKIAMKLFTLHGIRADVNLNDLRDKIIECCNARDQFAHGILVHNKRTGLSALRLTRGEYETLEGRADRSFIPQAITIDDDYYDRTRKMILKTAKVIIDLKNTVIERLKRKAPPEESAEPSC